MREIANDLARLADATMVLSEHVSRLNQAAERMTEMLGCSVMQIKVVATEKPLRRRNFKDALEAVLDARERIIQIEQMIAAITAHQVVSTRPE